MHQGNYCSENGDQQEKARQLSTLFIASTGINKNEQRFSKFTKHSAESES